MIQFHWYIVYIFDLDVWGKTFQNIFFSHLVEMFWPYGRCFYGKYIYHLEQLGFISVVWMFCSSEIFFLFLYLSDSIQNQGSRCPLLKSITLFIWYISPKTAYSESQLDVIFCRYIRDVTSSNRKEEKQNAEWRRSAGAVKCPQQFISCVRGGGAWCKPLCSCLSQIESVMKKGQNTTSRNRTAVKKRSGEAGWR